MYLLLYTNILRFFSVKSKEYFIDNTLRGVAMNPETLFAILAYAIGMVYVIKRHK